MSLLYIYVDYEIIFKFIKTKINKYNSIIPKYFKF